MTQSQLRSQNHNPPLCCTTNKNIRLCDPSACIGQQRYGKKQQRISTSLLRAVFVRKVQLL